ncbi:hypothetical protein [Alkalihalobacillus trypoxylicola]|uniref:Membrane protein YszA n=1 Tax=Alkalihalobacillus trypoxylicola TaxID=519424 RepID=A0A162ECR5_9BACI|nr:hypothetical protein [Alkalihalobacillus trypoxylicola]KYG32295.1 hypothetical protein AZF04_05890 [Alkalihalobacillus trypoxylicola]
MSFNKSRYYPNQKPSWWCRIRGIAAQILIPLLCFQFIRTLFLPTVFDVFLLTLMVVLYLAIWLKLI